ncbi:4'-phosphopantetheine phosphatase-like isoform X2 [Nematostella vectensis]|uniref:4'-phosphopantetheine phosphatase-like isoform X2 n=1 Tax=Nematostella vectensis TaxID=45351 RepID=UPI002077711C|nr:4'-phosphopantetheine phosphatase-like isoform X2 [Nematostella vectensis]
MDSDGDSTCASEYARSIDLPNVFRNIKNAKRFAVDIGGSLAKVAYMSEVHHIRKRHQSFSLKKDDDSNVEEEGNGNDGSPIYEILDQPECGVRLHFVKFETKYIEACIDFIRETANTTDDLGGIIKATGGGAFKYKDLLTTKLGVRVDKEDEMQCLLRGCNFVLSSLPHETFEFRRDEDPQYLFHHLDASEIFPYLLVNIGSGVSIVKVDAKDKFERIGGTSTGGGTFWGLGSLLTSAKGFDELLELATKGQHKNVDMLVRDIYGGAYTEMGLPGDLTACSFGKAMRSFRDGQDAHNFGESDIAKCLLLMISNDIAQIASLHARLYNIKRIFFSGFFIRGIPATMHTITYGINYWSKGSQQALFLRHEGYLGAIGAFLKGAEEDENLPFRLLTWGENYAGSSGLPEAPPTKRSATPENMQCDVLEIDQIPCQLVPFPLLASPGDYLPDTEDLTADAAARQYWLDCFGAALDKVVERAIWSQRNSPDVHERAEKFRTKYKNRLLTLYRQPCAFGALTVHSLLDTREQCLNEFDFPDPYAELKQQENEEALKMFTRRIRELDKMESEQRQIALVRGMLAGNVFDWGAREVSDLMEKNLLGFDTAMDRLEARPWLKDDLDEWISRTKGPPYKLAVVFVDNSGVDIILGVMPFVRELVSRGTKVILAANSYPALNDVMHGELVILIERLAKLCPALKSAVKSGRLVAMASGVGSPCLDLRRIDADLAASCAEAELVLLEGMGRCIHTNFHARFTCDSIKLAVIKNRWLAERLGGNMYSVVFKFERVAQPLSAT